MRFRGLMLSALLCACAASPKAPRSPSNAAKPQAAPATGSTYPETRGHTLTPDVVLSTIRDRYLTGVERCYSRHAKKLGTSSDRITVSFTVDEDGSTRDGDAHGITKRVDGCVKAQVARWTFPAPRKESAFSLGLQLSTD